MVRQKLSSPGIDRGAAFEERVEVRRVVAASERREHRVLPAEVGAAGGIARPHAVVVQGGEVVAAGGEIVSARSSRPVVFSSERANSVFE